MSETGKITELLDYFRDLGIEELSAERVKRGKTPSVDGEVAVPAEFASPSRKVEDLRVQPSASIKIFPPAQTASLFESPSISPAAETLEEIRSDLGDCQRCKLAPLRKHIVFGSGNPHAALMFVGEAPGADEDEQGLPFVGRAGQLLTRIINAMQMKREDVYICNVIKCRPPENRTPERDEIDACQPFLQRQIRSVQPKVIVCLGSPAMQTLLNIKTGITQIRGQWLEYNGIKLMATFHPAYCLRWPDKKKEVWADMQKVMEYLRFAGAR